MASFWGELKKRNVVKVAVAYGVVAWILVQVASIVFPAFNLPAWGITMIIVMLIIGAPVALLLAWAYELTPDGVTQTVPTISRRKLLTGAASLGLLGLGMGAGAFVYTRVRPVVSPSYLRLTFRRGVIRTARFMPDYQSVLYGALWDGADCRAYAVRPTSPESAPLDLPPAAPLGVSSSGEVAIALGTHYRGVMTYGTLARVPLAGGAPRELVEDVKFADWSPDGSELAIIRRVGDRDQLEYPIGTVLAESSYVSRSGTGGFSFPRISHDGNRVAFFDLAAGLRGSVTVVNRAGDKTTLTREYVNAFGLAWHGDDIWFTAAEERPLLRDAIMAISPGGKTRRVTRLIGNASLHDIAPDGRVLMAHTNDRLGITVHVSGDVGERDLSWLDSPDVVDISDDGEMILFTEGGVGGGPNRSVYLRRTDGSPAVRLSDGIAMALSPDARWVLRRTISPSSEMELVPTGPGETRSFARSGFAFDKARWLPGGGQVVVSALELNRLPRLYLLDLATEELSAITPEQATTGWALSPDGLQVAVSTPGEIVLYPIAGGGAQDAPDLGDDERLVGWIEHGLLVAVDPTGVDLGRIFTVDPVSGRRELWRDIRPFDPAGILLHGFALVVSPDGQSYAYSSARALSDLYIVDGLR